MVVMRMTQRWTLKLWIGIVFFTAPSLFSQNLTLFGGISIPDENVKDVFPQRIDDPEQIVQFIEQAISYGYHFGIRYGLVLSPEVTFTMSGSIHRFPELTSEIVSDNGDTVGSLRTLLNIVPIGFGVKYYLFRSLFDFYWFGNIFYTYSFTSTEISLQVPDAPAFLPMSIEPSFSRVGAGGGIGAAFNLRLFVLETNLHFWASNVIGRSSNEKVKSIVSLSLGIAFGIQ